MPTTPVSTPRRRWTTADCISIGVAITLGAVLGAALALAVITLWTN